MSDISARLPESEDHSAGRRMDEWEQCLHEAKGLDQIRAVIDGWREEQSTPGPYRSFQLRPFLKTIICRGDIPSLVYLLEEEQIEISWTAGHSALNEKVPEDKRPEVLEVLYRHGWDFNLRTQASGYTIMSASVKNGAAVRWLLNHGADPDARTFSYCTPICYAAQYGSLDTIKLLHERGADPTKGIPLKYAIMRKDDDWKAVIELFLDYGCDINGVHFYGISRCGRPRSDPGAVLHSAARWNRHHTIPFLLEKGADPLKLSEDGLTPAQYALEKGSEEAAAILAEAERNKQEVKPMAHRLETLGLFFW